MSVPRGRTEEPPPLEQIRAQHFDLHRRSEELSADLERGDRAGGGEELRRGLLETLTEFARALESHFALEERGGYFSEVLAVAPRLGERVERLGRRHDDFRRRVQRLLEMTPDSRIDWPRLSARTAELLRDLRDHETAENELVHEAFSKDLGGS